MCILEIFANAFQGHWYTLRGDNTVKIVLSPSEKGLLYKERICSHGEQILSL